MNEMLSAKDVMLIEDAARVLREGGGRAVGLRTVLQALLSLPPEPLPSHRRATTGEELLAFFRTCPLVEADDGPFDSFARDNAPGRPVDM